MPVPIIAGIAGSLLGSAQNFAMGKLTQIASSYVDCLGLYAKYDAANRIQSGMPDLGMGLHCYLNGGLSRFDLDQILNRNNFATVIGQGNDIQRFTSVVMDTYIKSVTPKLSLEQLIYCWYTGIINDDEFKSHSKNFKLREGSFEQLSQMLYGKFDNGMIINNYFRGIWGKEFTINTIRRFNTCTEQHAKDIIQSSQFIPPPQDLLRFAVRDVYDEQAAADLGLDDEFDLIKDIIPWAKAIGIGDATIKDAQGNEVTANILKQYWRAHWQLMSPQQGYQALHKLRPNRMQRYQGIIPNITPFDFNQLNRLLKSDDYVPKQRNWLAAISYNTIQKRDIKNLYNDGFIDQNELLEQLQDSGLLLDDATKLQQWYKKQKDDKDKKDKEQKEHKDYGKKLAAVYDAYKTGSISRDTALTAAFTLDSDSERVVANLDAIDIQLNNLTVKYLVDMIKKEFFLGLYDGLQAYTNLVQGGLSDPRARQYVIVWQRQLSRPRRIASINTVLDWYKRLLINFDDASARLANLGVSNNETLLYLESSNQDIEKRLLQEQAKKARTDRQAASDARALQRQAEASVREARALLRTYSSIADMKRWFIIGEIGEDEVINRMLFLGIPLEDINRYLTEWKG